jgi:anaerobic magnesium-protoporphyrin IX monomethyl ester cyclase
VKILLSYLSDSNDEREYSNTIVPSGLFPLAAHLEKAGHTVVVANFSHIGYRKALSKIEEFAPDITAFSILTHNRNDTVKLIKEIKDKNSKIVTVAGGPHASALSNEIIKRIPEIDYVIEGEGESGFDALLSKKGLLKPSRIISSKRLTDESALSSFTEFSGEMMGVNPHEQFKFITPTRGPLSDDPFSSGKSFWGNVCVSHSPKRVVDDMEKMHKKYGIVFFNITDEYFCSSEALMKEFCSEIISRSFYPMWSCQMHPRAVSQSLSIEMKRAGCERVYLTAWSGSERIIEQFNNGLKADIIASASKSLRNAGLYLSFFMRVGFYDEKKSDITKSIALIRECLPGDGIVFPAVYYPGTALYVKAVETQRLDASVMFEKKDKGLYLRNDPEVRSWMEQIRTELRLIRQKSWYKEKDFRIHRKNISECWVTDILEGDYYLDEERDRMAEQCYMSVVQKFPLNPWGHLRLGKLAFSSARFDAAEMHYTAVTELTPQFYGGWLKLAESRIAQGHRKEGKDAAQRAFDLNKWDVRVTHLIKNL